MIGSLSITALAAAFLVAALLIAVCGTRLTGIADRLADKTGLGEALAGAIFLGAVTSLSGTVVSVTAAMADRPSLAFANAIGGIPAQTAFLAIADILYRRANLEHAAAEPANISQCAILIAMLSLPLLAFAGPPVVILGMHPVSVMLPVCYLAGVLMARQVRDAPMWRPVATTDTRGDEPDEAEERGRGLGVLIVRFLGLAAVLGLSGWFVAVVGGELADRTGLSETAVGALMTAVATSLPELVTTVAAVRRGALQLAVGGIIGGNAFDVLFLTASDAAYRGGSIYHAIPAGDLFWLGVAMLMTSVLVVGLVLRQRRGPARIGLESALLLAIYGAAFAVQLSSA